MFFVFHFISFIIDVGNPRTVEAFLIMVSCLIILSGFPFFKKSNMDKSFNIEHIAYQIGVAQVSSGYQTNLYVKFDLDIIYREKFDNPLYDNPDDPYIIHFNIKEISVQGAPIMWSKAIELEDCIFEHIQENKEKIYEENFKS